MYAIEVVKTDGSKGIFAMLNITTALMNGVNLKTCQYSIQSKKLW